MTCETCGGRNAWGRAHVCRDQQCKGFINALQAFPFAPWDDVSGAKLDPREVMKAREVEIEYAEKKPVWQNVPRRLAKKSGCEIIKSRWIGINKGDDSNPNNRSRMVGKEFNDRHIDGFRSYAASKGSPPTLELGSHCSRRRSYGRRWSRSGEEEHYDCRCLSCVLRGASKEGCVR